MPTCIVKKCKNYHKKCTKVKDGISYFRFPADPIRKEIWCRMIKIQRNEPNFIAKDFQRICSAHFRSEDFVITKSGIRRLKETAIPLVTVTQTENVENTNEQGSQLHLIADVDANDSKNITKDCPKNGTIEQRFSHEELVDVDISDLQSIFDTPRKVLLKKKVKRLEMRNQINTKKIKNLSKQNSRLKKQNKSLSNIVKELRQKKYISDEIETALGTSVEIAELYRLQILKKKGRRNVKKRPSYPPALRKFAMTLNFYSPAAYKFVRRKFDCCLPHPRTLVKWYSSIEGNPGFTKEAFDVLKIKRVNMSENIEGVLIFDEMNIRQAKLWRGGRNIGHVDMGSGNIDTNRKATKVFVLMLVCLSENWKIPLGYFLVDGFTSDLMANTINICLEKCYSVGVNVAALTFDGCSTNIRAVNNLGCSIGKSGQLQTTFPHPVTKEQVVVFMDACHMIKLVRNVLEKKKVIFSNGQKIEWKFLSRLVKLQSNKKLNFANKLTPRHIYFKHQIMKVKLATQLLSTSVANAIKLCNEVLKTSSFRDSEATVEFITMFNNIFDILNSRRFNRSGFKRSMSENNKCKILEFIKKAIDYIRGLQIYTKIRRTIKKKHNQPRIIMLLRKKNVLDTSSKTGFLGFIVCLESLRILYQKLVERDSKLKYISTYRLSQDHLELFFGLLRKHGGYNDNPNAIQLKGAYRRALNHLSLKSSFTGNCIPLDNFPILTISSSSVLTINSTSSIFSNYDELYESDKEGEIEDDITISNNCENLSLYIDRNASECVFQHLTEDVELIIGYIAGWVAKSLIKKLKCEICINSTLSNEKLYFHKLIEIKNLGGLCFPSTDLFLVCLETEKNIRSFKESQFWQKSDFTRVQIKTLKNFVRKDIFSILNLHSYDQPATLNHRIHLIRAIIAKYIDVRMHHEAKMENFVKITKRQKFKKLVLFQGQ